MTEIKADYDLVVCGGGPAGLGAAVTAARLGARTLLIERMGHLGGMHTSAGVLNWCDTPGGHVFEELYRRMESLGGAHYRFDPAIFVEPGRAQLDTELSKAVMMQMLHDAGAHLLLLTHCEGAITENRRVVGVTVVNKSGRSSLRAGAVIDATADADIAASAGVPFCVGDPEDGRIQHCNFRVWYEGIDRAAYERGKPDAETLIGWLKAAQAAGEIVPPENVFQPQAATFPFNTRTGTFDISNWELERVDPRDGMQTSRVLMQCHVAVAQVIAFCRARLPGHEQMRLRKLPTVLGTRESRRIEGRYVLTRDDVVAGRKFDDGIARACFYMDLHDSPPGTTIPHDGEHVWARRPPRGDWYEIPYRCLLPKEIAGLLVAGRCISAEREAHGSVRAMPTCMATGAAAGCAVALARAVDIALDAVDVRRIREIVLPKVEPHVCDAILRNTTG